MTAELLEDLALLFQATVEEVRQSDAPALQKAEALSRMADAYTKTMKAAGTGDVRINRLTVALETIKTLGQFIAERFPEQLEPFVVILDQFDAHAAEVFGK
jgi:erythromycin esterase-like protein